MQCKNRLNDGLTKVQSRLLPGMTSCRIKPKKHVFDEGLVLKKYFCMFAPLVSIHPKINNAITAIATGGLISLLLSALAIANTPIG